VGLQFTIGGTTFSALASAAGNYALACDVDSPQQEIKRFHVPGGDGNYIVRGGRAGVRISVKMRYVGPLATVYSTFAANKSAWANSPVTVATAEASYTRCSLEPGGMKIVAEPQAKGDGTNVFMDAAATFVSDA